MPNAVLFIYIVYSWGARGVAILHSTNTRLVLWCECVCDFCVGPEVFEAHVDNAQFIWRDFRKSFTHKINGSVTSLSIGTELACLEGLQYTIEYFGDATMVIFQQHILKHLERILQLYKNYGGNVALWLFMTDTIDFEELKDFVWNKLGFHGKEDKLKLIMWSRNKFTALPKKAKL